MNIVQGFCFFVLISFFSQFNATLAQNTNRFASRNVRDSVEMDLIKKVDLLVDKPLNDSNLNQFMGVFWAMELMQYRPAGMEKNIENQFKEILKQPMAYQRAFFELIYTLYPQKFNKNVKKIWFKISSPKVKAMALEYLALSGIYPSKLNFTPDSLQLFYYQKRIQNKAIRLPMDAFLDKDFLPNQVLVCSFQHSNRNIPGFVRIRTKEHKWLKISENGIFVAPQMARAVTNLPYYLSNGNTPQGLFRFLGFGQSNNAWIGTTSNFQMAMPFEIDSLKFFDNNTNSMAENYRNLLGKFSNYPDLWQSFEAGKLGRSEIIAHGTTINPLFYKNFNFFPHTPSMGCLCSPEIWDENGNLVSSAQQLWVERLQALEGVVKYLLVVEID